MFQSITKHQWKLLFLAIGLLVLAYFILPISLPLIFAFVTALILNPTVRFFQQKTKFSRKISITIVFFLFLVLISFAGTFIVTKAITQLVNFVENVPEYFNELNDVYKEWEQDFRTYSENLPAEFVQEVSNSVEDYLSSLSATAKNVITIENITQIFAKVPQYLISFLVYLIALFLFMIELPAVKANLYKPLKPETAKKVSFMGQRLGDVVMGFFKAQFSVSIIIFFVSLIGLLIIIPEVAVIMSLVIWLIDLVPIIGSIAILGPWALFLLMTGDTALGVKLGVLAIVLLGIRRIVEPKVMGQQIGLSPLATLISMFLGIKLLGLFGFIIGPIILITLKSATEAGIIKTGIKI